MPIVQLDWPKIKSRLADDTALFALTLRQASMLLGLSEQLTWEKTFRVDDYDWADKDLLDADIADLQRNLAMPTNLVDIIQYIDEIEDILRALEQHAGCCDAGDISDGDHFTDSVTDGVGDVPQNIIDAGYATDAADWAGFDDYKCMIAHVSVDQLEVKTREISKAMDKESTTYAIIGGIAVLTGIITHIFTAGLSTLTVAILTSLGASSLLYKSLLDWELMEDLADDVATNHDALACAFYFSDGVDDSISQLNDKIDELFSAPEALVLKNLNIAPTVKALYAGRYDQADIAAQLEAIGYDTADFDCTCEELGEWELTFTFDTTKQSWVGGTWYAAEGDPSPGSIYYNYNATFACSMQLLRNTAEQALPGFPQSGVINQININKVTFHNKRTNSTAGTVVLQMSHTGGSYDDNNFATIDAWSTFQIYFPTSYQLSTAGMAARFAGVGGSANYQHLDTVTFNFDAFTV